MDKFAEGIRRTLLFVIWGVAGPLSFFYTIGIFNCSKSLQISCVQQILKGLVGDIFLVIIMLVIALLLHGGVNWIFQKTDIE